MNKNGITMVALTLYVVLLFGVTIFAVSLSNGVNKRLFDERGLAINITSSDKLQYNLLKSSKESNEASTFSNRIAFSNGDVYIYNSQKKVIYKNGTALVDNVDELVITSGDMGQISDGTGIEISVTFTKYLNELQRSIVLYVKK